MKEIVLHNDSDVDIVDYPVAEAVLDSKGNPKMDPDTQQPVTTGDTYTWTLKAGEIKAFPAYVANYLKKIYGFLEEMAADTIEEKQEEVPLEEKATTLGEKTEDGKLKCNICGQEIANIRGLGMHIAAKHPESLV